MTTQLEILEYEEHIARMQWEAAEEDFQRARDRLEIKETAWSLSYAALLREQLKTTKKD